MPNSLFTLSTEYVTELVILASDDYLFTLLIETLWIPNTLHKVL